MKQCNKCGTAKPMSEFHAHGGFKDGKRKACKDCRNRAHREIRAEDLEGARARSRARYAADPAKHLSREHAYRRADPGKYRSRERARYAACPERKLSQQQRMRLGISDDVISALRTLDCAICGSPPRSNGRRHDIDHDHAASGPASVRGVLCTWCNTTLGLFEEGRVRRGHTYDPRWAACAEQYLAAYEGSLRL